MSSPKHLWSGNWEDESQTAQSSLPAPPPPAPPAPAPAPPPAPSTHLRRVVALTVIAALVLVGVVWAITSSGSDTKHPNGRARSGATTTTAQQAPTGPSTAPIPGTTPPPSTTATSPATSASPADSLGLQLALVPVNRVIVQAVVPGSAADQVGIGADDLLESINGQRVTSPGQANAILAKLPKGSAVTLILVQGSQQIEATIQESNGP